MDNVKTLKHNGHTVTLEEFWDQKCSIHGTATFRIPNVDKKYDTARQTYMDMVTFEKEKMSELEAFIMTARDLDFRGDDLGWAEAREDGRLALNGRGRVNLSREELVRDFFNLLQNRKAEQQQIICKLEETTYESVL